jgi:putative transposase
MQLTERIRIFPTSEQEEVLWTLSERCRLLYNFALVKSLVERIEGWKSGKSIKYREQQDALPEIKRKCPEYKRVHSKVMQMVLRQLDSDYRSFFALWKKGDKTARPPGFKGRKHFTTMTYNQSGFRIENGKISLTHFYNDVPLTLAIPASFSFGRVYQVSIFKEGEDFYLSVVYEKPEKPYVDNGLYQAIDLGVKKVATAMNIQGKFLEVKNPRQDRYWQPKIAEVQSKRDHCRKGSRKWRWYNKEKRKMERKCFNQIRDQQHKLSRKLVGNTRANTIIVGNLSVKNMAQSDRPEKMKKGLNRATQNCGYLSRFAGFLTYKAELAGKKVIEISERDTTKMCCIRGKKHGMQIWNRIMECDCGNEIDRDRNSAVNIMVRFLSQNALVDGLLSFRESILRQTGLAIASYSQEAPCESEE